MPFVEAETPARDLETLPEELRELAVTHHPAAKPRIVVAAAAHRMHAAHDVLRLERVMAFEPVLEEVLHFPACAKAGQSIV